MDDDEATRFAATTAHEVSEEQEAAEARDARGTQGAPASRGCTTRRCAQGRGVAAQQGEEAREDGARNGGGVMDDDERSHEMRGFDDATEWLLSGEPTPSKYYRPPPECIGDEADCPLCQYDTGWVEGVSK